MSPIKEVSLISSRNVANRVTHIQKSEKHIRTTLNMTAGFPVQMRILDSRSYFFITASKAS